MILNLTASRFAVFCFESGIYIEDCEIFIGAPTPGSPCEEFFELSGCRDRLIGNPEQLRTLYVYVRNRGKSAYLFEHIYRICEWADQHGVVKIEIRKGYELLHEIPVARMLKEQRKIIRGVSMSSLVLPGRNACEDEVASLVFHQPGIVITSMLNDQCILTSKDIGKERVGIERSALRGLNFRFCWRALPGEKSDTGFSAYYEKLIDLLIRDGFVKDFEYYIYLPDGRVGHYVKDYQVVDDFQGEPIRLSSTGFWEIVSPEKVQLLRI